MNDNILVFSVHNNKDCYVGYVGKFYISFREQGCYLNVELRRVYESLVELQKDISVIYNYNYILINIYEHDTIARYYNTKAIYCHSSIRDINPITGNITVSMLVYLEIIDKHKY